MRKDDIPSELLLSSFDKRFHATYRERHGYRLQEKVTGYRKERKTDRTGHTEVYMDGWIDKREIVDTKCCI